jgi:hypothetical protein
MDNGCNSAKEAQLLNAYPPPACDPSKIHDQPMTLVDMHGVILAWYLPDVLGGVRQVCQTVHNTELDKEFHHHLRARYGTPLVICRHISVKIGPKINQVLGENRPSTTRTRTPANIALRVTWICLQHGFSKVMR